MTHVSEDGEYPGPFRPIEGWQKPIREAQARALAPLPIDVVMPRAAASAMPPSPRPSRAPAEGVPAWPFLHVYLKLFAEGGKRWMTRDDIAKRTWDYGLPTGPIEANIDAMLGGGLLDRQWMQGRNQYRLSEWGREALRRLDV